MLRKRKNAAAVLAVPEQQNSCNCYNCRNSYTIPYENEKELRLLYHDYKNEITSDYKGYSVDIGALIKEIYIGPMAKPYVKELIEKILSHHGLNIPVKQSMVK